MEAISDKLEKDSFASTQQQDDLRNPEEDLNNSVCMGLSQLSCSTANNEDFFIVPDSEEEGSLRAGDEKLEPSTLPAAGDAVSVRSVAAQTSSMCERPCKAATPFRFYGLQRPELYSATSVKEIRRIPNVHSPPSGGFRNNKPSLPLHFMTPFRSVPFKGASPSPLQLSPSTGLSPSFPAFPAFVPQNRRRGDSGSQHEHSIAESQRFRGSSSSASVHSRPPLTLRPLGCSSSSSSYPMLHISSAGCISLVISSDLLVELAVDRAIRIVSHDHLAVTMNARGTSSAILHPRAKILHHDDNVWTKFSSSNDKMTAFNHLGVFFTMSHLQEGYLVNSAAAFKGAVAVPLDPQQFSSMDQDFTVRMFYTEAQNGHQFMPLCKDIVHEATYERRDDGVLTMHVHGMHIRHLPNGELHIDARPRQITCNPRNCTVHLRSPHIDMAVQDEDKAYVKRGMKRVHVSRSGMVVSDGNCITSMDHFGRIVSCT